MYKRSVRDFEANPRSPVDLLICPEELEQVHPSNPFSVYNTENNVHNLHGRNTGVHIAADRLVGASDAQGRGSAGGGPRRACSHTLHVPLGQKPNFCSPQGVTWKIKRTFKLNASERFKGESRSVSNWVTWKNVINATMYT